LIHPATFVAAGSGLSNRAAVFLGFVFVVVTDLAFVVAVVAASFSWAPLTLSTQLIFSPTTPEFLTPHSHPA
jgi:hypothetical protein